MEDLEEGAIGNTQEDCKPKFLERYMDDTLEIIKRGRAEKLTAHLNTVDLIGSLKFIHEKRGFNTIFEYRDSEKRKWQFEVGGTRCIGRRHTPTNTWHLIFPICYTTLREGGRGYDNLLLDHEAMDWGEGACKNIWVSCVTS